MASDLNAPNRERDSQAATLDDLERCGSLMATRQARIGGMASTMPGMSTSGDRVGRCCDRRPGARIDRYELVVEIGSGAMGVVWLARDVDLDREVALKLIRSGGSSSVQLRARLLGEARAMARLPHPNVVAIYDVGTGDGGLFIAMERLDGGTLGEWLRAAPRSWTEVVDKFLAAGRGLAEAHRAGLVHRDFKPENVLLGRDGIARVGDFGLAVPALDLIPGEQPSGLGGEHALTQEGELVGTLAFMAPEQLLGDRATARSDQFSFCVALYEALYGQMPFVLPSRETHAAILLAAIAEARIAPPPAGRTVPRRLHDLLLRGLAYDPADRWPSMDAVVAELELCRRRKASQMRAHRRRTWAANMAAAKGAWNLMTP
jgi:serine/threonine protein kinase